ncbi:MAG: LamG domain protein jellyroll fold domain protein [Myxococcales bacterium]|nr:LamG domain protein jellyroll fold domain protein [Myxococcales bacterium]
MSDNGLVRQFVLLVLLAGCDRFLGFKDVTNGDAHVDLGGLVAYYPMDDLRPDLATCAPDQTGHHDGMCFPSAPALVPGKHGSAYAFDGSTAIAVAGAPDLDGTAGLTVAAWIALDSPAANADCPVNRVLGTADDDAWQICVLTSGMYYKVFDGSVQQTLALTLGTWHHVALSWSPTTMKGWLDGTQVGSHLSGLMFDNQPMVFGADIDRGAATAAFHGRIDEVRIYDRELAIDEIQALATP